MSERKQGKRSAAESQQTKFHILECAAELFCEQGFDHVSIRNIGDKAGVTHGLVRHYFGNKEQIWEEITQGIRLYMSHYVDNLVESIDVHLPANERLYQFSIKLMAIILLKPQLIQIMVDFLHRSESNVVEFEQNNEVFKKAAIEFTQAANEAGYDLRHEKLTWQFMMYAGGAVTFRPLMKARWGDNTGNFLLEHWRLYEELIAQYAQIEESKRCNTDSLDKLVVKFECSDELRTLFISK